jgi:hypothetical protein
MMFLRGSGVCYLHEGRSDLGFIFFGLVALFVLLVLSMKNKSHHSL